MADTNLEDVLEQLQFNYGGVLQKLAELHDEVVDQMEMLKTAGTKIRRRNTSYAKDTVLVCVGRNNGNKFLKCKTAGTTSDVQWTEATYTGFTIGSTVNDGTVVWEVMETAFTSGSIVWSAMNASHAEIADYASSAGSATSAGYALSAGYIGPFHVHQGARVESQTIVSSGVTSTFDGFNVTVQDDTRPAGTGGYIVNGNQNLPVQSFANFLADGKTLYLFGSSGNPPYFECGFYFGDPKTPGAGEFVTALAKNEGGKIIQMQFGDIVTPWPGGEDGEDYDGPFKVFIVGSSSVISNSGTASQTSSMKYDFELYDPTSPINSNTNKHEWGGKVFAGESYYQAGITSGSVKAGDFIYLVGDSRAGEVTFKYTNYEPEVTSTGGSNSSTGKQTITSAGFFTRIAQVHGASVTQIQHGDITVPPWKVAYADYAAMAASATHATYADNVDYKGPFRVATSGTGIQVYDDSWPNTFGGAVIIGSNGYRIGSATGLTSQAGFKIYLEGTSNYDGAVSLRYRAIQDGATISALKENQFLTPLATITSGGIMQIQYGNITQPFHTEEYQGPFKVGIAGTSTVVSNSGTESATSSTVYTVTITDTISAGETPADQKAGKVFDGAVEHEVASSSIELADGQYVYLQGSSAADGTVEFEFVTTPDDAASTSLFFTRLAKNQGGKIIQIHEGDIVTPWHAGGADFASMAQNASNAVRATVADYVEYKGPFHVSALNDSTVKVYDDSRPATYGGAVVIGESTTYVGSQNLSVENGDRVYLVGTSAPGGTLQCVYSVGSGDSAIAAGANQFCTQLAFKSAGVMIQTQFGDIVQPFHTEEYEGPFKVVVGSSSTVITSSGTSAESSSTTYQVSILDTISAAEVSSDQKAGKVFNGLSAFEVPSSAITVNDGDYIYLRTSYSTTSSATSFEFTTSSGSENRTRCFTRLAKNQGGKIVQIQHGDITVPEFALSARYADSASSAVHATEADRFAYKGPFNASWSVTGQHLASIKFFDDIRNKYNDSSWAGAVIVGDSTYKVTSSSLGLILNGYRIYLKGTFVDGSAPSFVFGSVGSGSANPSVNANEFYTYLGFVSNGAFVRTQYGDIVQPVLGQGQSYNGPFKVQITSSSTTSSSSGGSTISNTTYDVRVYDPTDPSSNPYHAGRVFDGASETILNSADIIGLEDGAFVYLNGISGSGMGITDSAGANNASSFSIRLAQVSAGGIVQMQYGDVYSIPWNVTYANQAGFAASANTALEADYASSAGYIGPFHVSATSVNSVTNAATVTIYDDTRVSSIGGYVVVGSNAYPAGISGGMTLSNGYKMYLIGSSTSSGFGFLYSAASSDPAPASGETWMFCAQLAYNNGGKVVQTHYGDIVQPIEGVKKIIAGDNVTVSPAEGVGEVTINATGGGSGGGMPYPNYGALNAYNPGGGSNQSLVAGSSYVAASPGWLRISIANSNSNCVALIVNGNRIGIYGYSSNYGITPIYPIGPNDVFSVDGQIGCMYFDGGVAAVEDSYIVVNSTIFYFVAEEEGYTSWTAETPMPVEIDGSTVDVYTVYTNYAEPSRYDSVYLESTLETYVGNVRWRNPPF